jgi:adenine deaminase
MKIEGNLIDIHNREIYPARISVNGKKIESIVRIPASGNGFIMPGLTDSHIHIESSMLTPGSFALSAVSRGTTAVVSDPHEIANVMGMEGIRFMLDDSQKVPLKFFFGAPSCVPATSFESSGAAISADDISLLMGMKEIKFLAEVMNYPGVIYGDEEIFRKIESARKMKKPVDGHAPGLSGESLRKYVKAGISTDHECTDLDEAKEKMALGMKILIREGSAAKNLDTLKPLYGINPDMIMLCSDDLHPEMLIKGHINALVARLVSEGYDMFDVIRSCTLNPARHYNLDTGLLVPGDPADFIIVDHPARMNVLETWIEGSKVYDNGTVLFDYTKSGPVNNFNCTAVDPAGIKIPGAGVRIRVIEAFDGSLLTRESIMEIKKDKFAEPDISRDILKIVVKDRYRDLPPSAGFISGFKMTEGAFASSVAHDSHNIICIGTNDRDILSAMNQVVKMKGGLAVACGEQIDSLPLPVAGIISDDPAENVASAYEQLSGKVKAFGCKMSAPFMTLSFMALLVIPELKISDMGLFDGRNFRLTGLFADQDH